MKSFQQIAGVGVFAFCEYILKCLTGVAVGYFLYTAFPQQSGQYLWMLISILLSITHDNDSKVAYDRMRGNILGSLVGLFVFFLHNPPNLWTICVGVTTTIAICSYLKLIGVARTALVAFIIVVLYKESPGGWERPVYRMTSVVIGCFIGLVINYVFRRITMRFFPQIGPAAGKAANGFSPDTGE